MTKNFKIAVFSLSAVALGLSAFAYMKQPKISVIVNKDGSGILKLGNQTTSFSKEESVSLKSWNGFEISINDYVLELKRNSKIIERTGITSDFGGTSRIYIQTEYDSSKDEIKQVKIDKATDLVLSSFTPKNPFLDLFKNP